MKKRILALALVLVTLFGSTLSVSAAPTAAEKGLPLHFKKHWEVENKEVAQIEATAKMWAEKEAIATGAKTPGDGATWTIAGLIP